MENLDLDTIKKRSIKLRQLYHKLELANHGSEWSVEEDALAFISDAGLVGRHTMSQQGRWPHSKTDSELKHKLGECIWWITVLAHRMDIDINDATEHFLSKMEKLLKE